MKVNFKESLWSKYKKTVEANKEKRRLQGADTDNEPQELIIDNVLLNDIDNEGKLIKYPWRMYHLLSQQWVYDMFGEDWWIVQKLLSVRDVDMVMVEDKIYYRESYIKEVLDVLTTLAKTKIVNQLRPIPTVYKALKPVYTSQDLMTILNVKESTLRKYRDDCLIDYSKVGDKIWYTEENLNAFLIKNNINNLN